MRAVDASGAGVPGRGSGSGARGSATSRASRVQHERGSMLVTWLVVPARSAPSPMGPPMEHSEGPRVPTAHPLSAAGPLRYPRLAWSSPPPRSTSLVDPGEPCHPARAPSGPGMARRAGHCVVARSAAIPGGPARRQRCELPGTRGQRFWGVFMANSRASGSECPQRSQPWSWQAPRIPGPAEHLTVAGPILSDVTQPAIRHEAQRVRSAPDPDAPHRMRA